MSRKLLSLQTKIITFLMGLLGFSACSDAGEEPVEMYGTPSAQFVVKGSVVNQNEQPIQNIKTVVEFTRRNSDGKTIAYPMDSVQTNAKGEFEIKGYIPYYNSKFAMRLEDIDDETNGSYQNKTDTVQFSQEDFKPQGNWQSTATKDIGKVVLNEKDETTEEPK